MFQPVAALTKRHEVIDFLWGADMLIRGVVELVAWVATSLALLGLSSLAPGGFDALPLEAAQIGMVEGAFHFMPPWARE